VIEELTKNYGKSNNNREGRIYEGNSIDAESIAIRSRRRNAGRFEGDIRAMNYNLFRPWETLDAWQIEYIETPPEQDCFLLNGRQTGKTTAMSIKSVELCVKHFKSGENVLIASLTEK
jgi:hypothetical protein